MCQECIIRQMGWETYFKRNKLIWDSRLNWHYIAEMVIYGELPSFFVCVHVAMIQGCF